MFAKFTNILKSKFLNFEGKIWAFKPFISQQNRQFLTCTSLNKKPVLAQSETLGVKQCGAEQKISVSIK